MPDTPKSSSQFAVDPEIAAAIEEAAEPISSGDDSPTDAAVEVKTPSPADAVTEAMMKAKNELKEALEQTRKEADKFRDSWLRSAADLENYRKRATREREDVVKFGNERLLKDFLPVVDDLERTLEAVEKTADDSNPAGKALLDGVKLVYKKLISQLEKHQVKAFDSVGEAFDPARHEAVQQVHDEAPVGAVVTEFQRGFMLNERLLRPAMVIVSLGPEKQD